jgi:flagellar motor switch protein FliN
MPVISNVALEIAVVLGKTRMPIHQLLRMGRGAVIALDATEDDEVEITANDQPFARGKVTVQGNRVSVEVTELLRQPQRLPDKGTPLADSELLAA